MKDIYIILLLSMLSTGLAAGNWQTITNTSHVFDLMVQGEDVYFSTWGGVVKLSPPVRGDSSRSLSDLIQAEVWTTADGIASNDVRNIEYINQSQSLWLGSSFDGISIISPQGVQQVNTSLGLPSNRISKIVEYGSNILVATANGLASFYYLEGVNFPLILNQYTVANTDDGLLSDEIDAMVLAPNNYLYFAFDEGISYVHLDSLAVDSAWGQFTSPPVPIGTDKKLAVNGNYLAVATPNAVYLHSIDPFTDGWQSITTADGLQAETLASVCLGDQNTVWVSYGSWNEDFLYYERSGDILMTTIGQDGTVKHWSAFEDGLRDKSVSRIVSQNGRIYLCTWGDGVFNFESSDNLWHQYLPNTIGFPKIVNIATDQNHAAWFSSGGLREIPQRKSALGTSKYLDGEWHTYNIANSPIHTDNILTVAVDSRNRKWFGTYDVVEGQSPVGWLNGLTVWDEDTGEWKHFTRWGIRTWNYYTETWNDYIPGSPTLMSNTIGYIARDLYGNMLVAGYDRGFSVFDPDDNLIGEFTIPNSVFQRSTYAFHNGRQYFIGTYSDRGLEIWNHDSIPVTGGDYWLTPPPTELSNCQVYGVVTVESPYEGIQHWIAASTGLFMWNETDWFKYDTSIKRFRYNIPSNPWVNDVLYYVDEERLFGSVRTTPTAIFLDPFDRIWIGSLEHGISMYDPRTERFTNYYTDNSPLVSDYITAFGYDPVEGFLLIGTPDGLNTLRIGKTIKPETTLQSLKAYPNPFHPDREASVQIVNQPVDVMPQGTNECRIYDISGALVVILEENNFSRFEWDGTNGAGKECQSGIYFFVVTSEDGRSKKGKIALIRG
jgi:hypothetical protein